MLVRLQLLLLLLKKKLTLLLIQIGSPFVLAAALRLPFPVQIDDGVHEGGPAFLRFPKMVFVFALLSDELVYLFDDLRHVEVSVDVLLVDVGHRL